MKKRSLSLVVLMTSASLWAAPRARSIDPLMAAFAAPGDSAEVQTLFAPGVGRAQPDFGEHRFRAAEVVSDRDGQTWTLNQSASVLTLSQSPVLSNSNRVVPDELWDVSAGASWRKEQGDRKDVVISGGVGSASDTLFHSSRELSLRATAAVKRPSGPRNAWIALLAYSNNRDFLNNIPLPGVAYWARSANSRVDAVLGFPLLFVGVRPTEKTALRMSAFGPTNLSAEGSVRVAGPIQVYAGFDWNQKEWFRADRTDRNDRIFYEQKKWSAGVRSPVSRAVRLDVSAGSLFHRRFYEDNESTSDPKSDVSLKSTWFVQMKVQVMWGNRADQNGGKAK